MSRRGGHGGHHGGAWKVAYADFVTAMMALFLVLWLVGSDEETKQAVQRYFKGEKDQQGRRGSKLYTDNKPLMNNVVDDKVSKDLVALEEIRRTIEQMRKQLNNSSEPGEDIIRFEFIADGVRIIALDRAKKPFFNKGTAELTDLGKWVLNTMAWTLERYPMKVEIEGHTEKLEKSQKEADPGWDLSAQRALAAQLALENGGIKDDQFWRVAGYADRVPLDEKHPEGEENRRISIVVRVGENDNVENLRYQTSTP